MALTLITGPATEPLTTAEAKLHLRVDVSDDDALIAALIVAARRAAESATRRAFVTQTWEYVLDAWPDGDTIPLPLPPLQSVTSLIYTDEDGNDATMSSSDYLVDADSEPGRVALAAAAAWPTATLQPVNGVRVRFVAGYGGADDVPQDIKSALLLLIGHWYENREVAVTSGAVPKEIPFGVNALLWPHRVLRWL